MKSSVLFSVRNVDRNTTPKQLAKLSEHTHSVRNDQQSVQALTQQSRTDLNDIQMTSRSSEMEEPQIPIEEKERVDWDRQFCLCKGTDIIEESVKAELLGEIYEVVEASQ